MVFVICTNTQEYFRDQFFLWRCDLIKIRCTRNEVSWRFNRNFPLHMSNNFLENISADSSFYNTTRIFVLNLRVFTYLHKLNGFKQTLISSAPVDLGMTGNVWRKSLPSRIIVSSMRSWLLRKSFNVQSCASNALLCVIVPSIPNDYFAIM